MGSHFSDAPPLQLALTKPAAHLTLSTPNLLLNKHVWPWKGWQGSRKGRRQASPQDFARQHPGHHQARDPSSRSSWRGQAYLWPDLRGDAWRPQDLPREHHPRLGHLHRARQAQDCHLARRCLRPQARRQDPLRLRSLEIFVHKKKVASPRFSLLFFVFLSLPSRVPCCHFSTPVACNSAFFSRK